MAATRRRRRTGWNKNFGRWLNETYLRADWWHMQDQPPSTVLAHVGPALALGRNLAVNGDFVNWTGVAPNDSPDGWTTTQAGDASSNVTQNPAGQCQIISDGAIVQITKELLEVGKSFIATMNVNAITGTIQWNGGAGASENITTTGAKSFPFTATSAFFIIKRSTACNATIDNVTVKQTGILASSVYAPGTDPMNLTNVGLTAGVAGSGNVDFVVTSDAVNDVAKFASIAEVNSKIDFSNGSIMMVASASTWAAGVDVLARFAVDDDNEIIISRSATNLICTYKQTGTAKTVTIASGSPTEEFTIGMDWDVDDFGMRAFYKGAQSGTDQAIAAAIVGNLDITKTCFFSNVTTLANVWAGNGAHAGLWHTTPTLLDHSDYHQRSGLA